MGDSRNNSADSRIPGHGGVPVANVIGQVRLIVMPFSRFRRIPSIDPHATPIGMGAAGMGAAGMGAVGTDAVGTVGSPGALGLLAVLPVLGTRRRRAEFLPPPARRRRRL
jgi:signal peptidase I